MKLYSFRQISLVIYLKNFQIYHLCLAIFIHIYIVFFFFRCYNVYILITFGVRRLKNNWTISLLNFTSTILNVEKHASGCLVCLLEIVSILFQPALCIRKKGMTLKMTSLNFKNSVARHNYDIVDTIESRNCANWN